MCFDPLFDSLSQSVDSLMPSALRLFSVCEVLVLCAPPLNFFLVVSSLCPFLPFSQFLPPRVELSGGQFQSMS